MKIAITGHRPNKLGNDYDLTGPLIGKIKSKLQSIIDDHVSIHYGDVTLISGMALGIDTLWAELAIENNLPLIAAIPCKGQESRWTKASIERYNRILNNPLTTVVMVSEEPYNNSCMQDRNIYMVDECDLLIGIWDGTTGGTGNCVEYAKSISRNLIIINPKLILKLPLFK